MSYFICSHGNSLNYFDLQELEKYKTSLVESQTKDTSVAIIKDGKMISFVEEERFNRIRHSPNRFPYRALRFSLQKINKDETFYLSSLLECKYWNFEMTNLLNTQYKNVIYYNPDSSHHLVHAYYSFYNSGFDHAAVLIVDGIGTENDSITYFKAEKNKPFIQLKKYNKDISLGNLYTKGTSYIGYSIYDEGKFMGLSAYGKPDLYLPLYNLSNGIKINCNKWKELFYQFYPFTNNKNKNNVIHYANFSATIQYWFNKVILYALHELKELCPEETNLCLCGGCFLNGIINNLIIKEGLFEHYFCPPWTNDAGSSIGNAYIEAEKHGEILISERVTNPFYGTEILDTEVEKIKNIEKINKNDIIELIQQGNIIGWVQGKSEMGPRALGHRSIIADPTNRENFYKINTLIKHREDWRPLSPIVPEELFNMLFDVEYNHDLFEFMLRITTIKQEWRTKIPAVCHIDNTTRPQLLKKEINPELYDIMIQLWDKYKIPCLINTSLNDRGEPIVETIKDALNFFNKTPDLDCLIFNSKYLLKKRK